MKNQKSYKNPVDKAPAFQQGKKTNAPKTGPSTAGQKPTDPKQVLLDKLQAKTAARKAEAEAG
jgi:hypothetical protein